MLCEKYDNIELEPRQVIRLGLYCVFILEALNILVDDGLLKKKEKLLLKLK